MRFAENFRHATSKSARAWSKGQRGATALLAGIRPRIEAAQPLPWLLIVRLAHAACDGADVDISEIDVPAVEAFRVSAAGELGHCPLKRGRPGHGKPLQIAVDDVPGTTEARNAGINRAGLLPAVCA